MKALVTGGAGFIGSHIAERLITEGHKVIVFDNFSSGKKSNIPPEANIIMGDITDPAAYIRIPEVDVIFHNAASKKNICLKNPLRDLEVNGSGTLRLLLWAKRTGVKKFVHASTGSVYGRQEGEITEDSYTIPVSYYGNSKLTGENYVRYFNYAYGLNTTVLRYFHVYGQRQEDDPELGGVVAIFKRQIKEQIPLTIHGDGEQTRVFTHVEDVVEANIQSWKQYKAYGKIYNCAASRRITINQLADSLMNEIKVEKKYTDPLEGDIRDFNVNADKIKELGVTFRDFVL